MATDITPTPRFHDPWLTASGEALKAVGMAMANSVEGQLGRDGRRTRQDIAARRLTLVENIAANLVVLTQSPDYEVGKRLAISTNKHRVSRYDRPDFPQRPLAGVLKTLDRSGLIHHTPHEFKRAYTTIAPSARFWEMVQECRATISDVGRAPGAETIWLGARKDNEEGKPRFFGERQPKVLVQYEDTPETIRLREEMETINACLNKHVVAFAGVRQPPIHMVRWFLLRRPSDPIAFDLVGRLAQGWWMSLPKEQRYLVTIDGEDTVDVDWQGMWAQLLYVRAGLPLPGFDPYAVPGLERHRAGAKTAFLSMVARKGPMVRLTKKLKAELPEGWDSRQVVQAIEQRHVPIKHYFGQDLAVDLMAMESRILVRLLLDLASNGIPFLPVHDGGQARRRDRDAVMEAMRRVSTEELGVELPVVEKPIWRPSAVAA